MIQTLFEVVLVVLMVLSLVCAIAIPFVAYKIIRRP